MSPLSHECRKKPILPRVTCNIIMLVIKIFKNKTKIPVPIYL